MNVTAPCPVLSPRISPSGSAQIAVDVGAVADTDFRQLPHMMKNALAGVLLEVTYGALQGYGRTASPGGSHDRIVAFTRVERHLTGGVTIQDKTGSIARRPRRRPRWTALHPVHLVLVVASAALLLTAVPPTGLP